MVAAQGTIIRSASDCQYLVANDIGSTKPLIISHWSSIGVGIGTEGKVGEKSVVWRFDGVNIPRGSTINTASIELIAKTDQTGAVPATISGMLMDGVWDDIPQTDQLVLSDTYDHHLTLRNGSTAVVGFSIFGAVTGGVPLRSSDQRASLYQVVESTSSSGVLVYIQPIIQRNSSVAGNLRMNVWSVDGNQMPDTLLGTTNPWDISQIGNNFYVTITMVLPVGISYPSGTKLGFELTADYPVHIMENIFWGWRSAAPPGPYAAGKSGVNGSRGGFGPASYPTPKELEDAFVANSTAATVAWAIPNQTEGATVTTPDITTIMQETIDAAGWTGCNPVAFNISHDVVGETNERAWYAFEGAPPSATLNVTFTPPVGPKKRIRTAV